MCYNNIDEAIIEALTLIGNHKEVIKLCEPHIMQSLQLKEWMVVRVLKAQEIFVNEWRIYQATRGTVQEVTLPDEGTIYSDS